MTQDELKELVSYDPDTGIFTRLKVTSNRVKVGQPAGWKDADGYLSFSLKGKSWKCHRLAWLYMTGSFPKQEIDHINRIKDDNRFCNLRDVDRATNERNKGLSVANTSGFKGVSFNKTSRKWEAYAIGVKPKLTLGYFDTAEQAAKAVKQGITKGTPT